MEAHGGHAGGLDSQILRMLLDGYTDTTVALRLGVGRRTVQRRIRQMMDTAGVNTRIQLGWHAREHFPLLDPCRPAPTPGRNVQG
ncbi:helix-turn-helix domain-containing protein [Streptomyces abyssomicinicus]|uniref:helix-turn-helix domain-containing protein n=1 Tax=Streptomyces abyssomicinicus TaxID=574929 RepID=UPI00125053EA|nr:helix-turn-helix transcriptional regulator [Streptomyces abyssomicinicus]